MEEIEGIFKKVKLALEARPWFKREKWQVSYHPFPSTKPEAITLHVFKKHWFNADTRGIHIESFLYLDPKKRKKSSVHIHLFHEDKVPGTKLKRMAVSKPVVDAIQREISSWKGYKFRAGKYGLQPFTKELNGRSATFADELSAELEKLCRYAGPRIDEVLEKI